MGDAVLPDNWLCSLYNDGKDVFPCNAGPIQAVSLGIATGGLSLLFTIWLTKKVNPQKLYEVNFI
jgi:hypothetical protein